MQNTKKSSPKATTRPMIDYEAGQAETYRTTEEEIELLQRRFDMLEPEEQRFVFNLLKQEALGDETAVETAKKLRQLQYSTQPLSFKEWINDPYYASAAGQDLYDEYVEDGQAITTGDYLEVILTGGIGSGKSFFAGYLAAYDMYLYTCYKRPKRMFGLSRDSELYYGILSLSGKHAKANMYESKFRPILENSQYFQDIGVKTTNEGAEIPGGLNVMMASTKPNDVIGLDLYGFLADEVNFGHNNRVVDHTSDGEPITSIEKSYSVVRGRQKSRFIDNGFMPGLRILVSSKNSDKDFTAKRITKGRSNSQIYAVDKREWDVKPDGKYSGETFRVFYGGYESKSRILDEDEPNPDTDDPNSKVIEIPIEYYEEFKSNLKRALRDIAGVSVPSVHPYIPDYSKISQMWDKRKLGHPFPNESWESSQKSGANWEEICNKTKTRRNGIIEEDWTPKVNPDAPRHIHVDPSRGVEDDAGLVMAHKVKDTEIPIRDPDTGDVYREEYPLIYVDLVLQITSPKRGEIKFSDIRGLIYEINSHGFDLRNGLITMDSWNTADTVQQLDDQGFPVEVISVDRNPEPYSLTSDALYEGRISCYKHSVLEYELKNIEKDEETGKVDHQSDGSKDIADALAGTVFSITRKGSVKRDYSYDDKDDRKQKHPMEQYQTMGGHSSRRSSNIRRLL